ncbi:hypothetical protein HEP87_40440 [Streptomyces sp. S1D4-11]|nr:hypothetical protein [Streptomyces sp. S1D4-11]
MNAAPVLVGYTAAVGFVAPYLLLRAHWPHRAPALAASVWHALVVSFSIGAALAAYNLAMPGIDDIVSITSDPADLITRKTKDMGPTTPVLSDPGLKVSQRYGAN